LVSLVACCGVLSPISLILGLIAATKKPRGFAVTAVVLSILGLLVIVAWLVLPLLLIGLLGGIAGAMGLGTMVVQFQGAAIAANVEQYIQANGTVPASLASVPDLNQGMTEDPWGTPFIYEPDPVNNTYRLASAGPDGLPGTGDDIEIETDMVSDIIQQQQRQQQGGAPTSLPMPGSGQGGSSTPAPSGTTPTPPSN